MKQAAVLTHGPLNVIGGLERYTRYLLDFLKEEDFEVDFYEPSMVNSPTYLRRFFSPFLQYYFGKQIGKQIRNYDLIVTLCHIGGFLRGRNIINISFGSTQTYLHAVKKSYNHKFLFKMYMLIIVDRMSKKGKLCVSACPQAEGELRRDYGVKSELIPCGIDTKHFSKNESGQQIRLQLGIKPEAFVGVFVGRWDIAHKRLDILIPIMRERTDVHWIIVPDCDPNLKGVRNLTVLLDKGYEELPSLYSAADFSIQLSRYESFGFSFVESLSCSVPVISTPVGIASYLYDDPFLNQLLVRSNGPQAENIVADVHAKIEKLKDRQYLEILAARGRAKVEKEFSLEVWKERMRNLLRVVLEGN